jgi:predicted acylesterase/phospholipase RssA
MKTVSLVLGSGGARGLAHIGIIHWLEENDYKIHSIAGSSIGALIGGIYAAGKLDEFEQWVRSITKLDIVTLLDPFGAYPSFLPGTGIQSPSPVSRLREDDRQAFSGAVR